ncbi:MAG: DUF1642 domain-containing protein [Streptococcaceae bacterium]|jgi:hypothetical protein|nr:DUF1642 domain-containing protein [Streptococcaceae bacterium]
MSLILTDEKILEIRNKNRLMRNRQAGKIILSPVAFAKRLELERMRALEELNNHEFPPDIHAELEALKIKNERLSDISSETCDINERLRKDITLYQEKVKLANAIGERYAKEVEKAKTVDLPIQIADWLKDYKNGDTLFYAMKQLSEITPDNRPWKDLRDWWNQNNCELFAKAWLNWQDGVPLDEQPYIKVIEPVEKKFHVKNKLTGQFLRDYGGADGYSYGTGTNTFYKTKFTQTEIDELGNIGDVELVEVEE